MSSLLHIHGAHTPAGDLPGVCFTLRRAVPAAAPRLVVQASDGCLVLSVDGRDHLFARVHPHLQGVHIGVAPTPELGALPPIRVDTIRAVESASRDHEPFAWARWFARAVAEANLFAPGDYAITEALDGTDASGRGDVGAAPSSLVSLDPVAPCLDAPRVSWLDWFGDDRDVLRLRQPSAVDAARVRAWRRRACDGTLPPVLLWFVAGLDTCVLLDGHDRLLAAREEGVAPRLLVLWRYSVARRSVDRARQEGLVGELRDRRAHPSARRPALSTDQENKLLLEAFPPSVRLHPTTRATALRGGAAAFAQRARAALGARVDERFLLGREPEGEAIGCSTERCGPALGWIPGS